MKSLLQIVRYWRVDVRVLLLSTVPSINLFWSISNRKKQLAIYWPIKGEIKGIKLFCWSLFRAENWGNFYTMAEITIAKCWGMVGLEQLFFIFLLLFYWYSLALLPYTLLFARFILLIQFSKKIIIMLKEDEKIINWDHWIWNFAGLLE